MSSENSFCEYLHAKHPSFCRNCFRSAITQNFSLTNIPRRVNSRLPDSNYKPSLLSLLTLGEIRICWRSWRAHFLDSAWTKYFFGILSSQSLSEICCTVLQDTWYTFAICRWRQKIQLFMYLATLFAMLVFRAVRWFCRKTFYKFSFRYFRPLSDPHETQAIAVGLAEVLISAGKKKICLQNFIFRFMARMTVCVSNLVFGKFFGLSDARTALK